MFDRLRRLGRQLGLVRQPRVNLALQGGGSHGAFTWGVLDRLLEDGIDIEGISGASAGALNAAALASGWAEDGRQGARRRLEALWRAISDQARTGPAQSTPLDYLLHGWNRDWSPGFVFLTRLTRLASPYELNPAGYNPIIDIVNRVVDLEAINRPDAIRLFVSLTNVHTGKLELRRNGELNARVLAASACLPLLFQAVEIDGSSYWDGGYTGNPALFPLIFECDAPDVILVQLIPEYRASVPRRVEDIVDRAREIAFHANLTRELQLIELLQAEGNGWLGGGRRQLHLHQIDTQNAMDHMGQASRINADWPFLSHLRDLGREHAGAWLERHGASLGWRSSLGS